MNKIIIDYIDLIKVPDSGKVNYKKSEQIFKELKNYAVKHKVCIKISNSNKIIGGNHYEVD